MYRLPNTSINDFLETFNSQMNKINATKSECIIGLDHNPDLLKQSIHPRTQEFLECILDQNLLPAITKLTRINKTSATLIDNILLSKKLPEYESLIIIDDLSDHLPCLVSLKNFQQIGSANLVMKRIINNKAINSIKEDLFHVDWNQMLSSKSASDSFHSFHRELLKVLNKHAPEKLIKETPKKLKTPWMSNGLKQSILRSKKLYEKALLDPELLPKYKDYMSTLRKCKRKLKLTYYQNKCVEFKKNGKKMWEMINKINGKINDKTCVIDYLKVNNIKYLTGQDITNQFAKYFCSVGKNFALKTEPSKNPLKNYLNKIPANCTSMFFEPPSVEEVSRLINNLKPKNSSGYDDISNKLLKTLHPVITEPFTENINRSLQEGSFPDDMK